MDMLTNYRRHSPSCKNFKHGSIATNCSCPIWTYGTVGGRQIRQSLNSKDWTFADRLKQDIENGVPINGNDIPSTADAVRRYLDECELVRKIKYETVRSYRVTLESFAAYITEQRIKSVSAITPNDISGFRLTRTATASSTQYKDLSILSTFFAWCADQGWGVNPLNKIRFPKKISAPTLPFDESEVSRLIGAIEKYEDPILVKAIVFTLLYTGLRVSDLVQLERSKVGTDGIQRIQKTGIIQYLPLKKSVIESLNDIPGDGKYFFWDGHIRLNSATSAIRDILNELGLIAGVKNVHPHRFRDTFAVNLLNNGTDIRTVQQLLGHSSVTVTEKHYAPWVKSMQKSLDSAIDKLDFGYNDPQRTAA